MFAPPVAKPTTKSAEPQRATVVPQLPSQAAVTQAQLLQRRIGNQAMIRLLAQRASVTRNEPGAQEKEADAARTAGREAAPSWDFSKIPVFSPGRAERFQMPPLFPAPRLPIQAKLKVGAVDDPLEHEADRVAEQVMRMPAPEVSAAAPPQVSRKCDSCEEDEKLQKKPAGPEAAAGEAPGIVHEVLRSPGQPLDAATRGYFEPRFRHDFGQVRVHTDAKAAESAQAVNALAYTMGRDVVFEAGQYAPEKIEGQRLLAHELAHVVQQQGISPTIQKKDGGAADSGWTELAQKARKARVSGNLKEATKLYQEAIVAAVAGAIFPAGLAKTTPKPEDIRVDYELFKKGPDAAFAETRSKEVPANETNYWRWIYFAPESVLDTQAHTEAVITHELVHVHQYEKLWNAYKSDKSEGKPSWEEYIKPYSRTKRVLGPEELEAHVTSLDFLERLSIAGGDDSEQVQTLRGLFVAYIRTSDYTPAKGETMAITTAVTGPRILDFYKKADAKLQEHMGKQLWNSLLRDPTPAKETLQAVLRELKPIAVKGYSDVRFRQLYDRYLLNLYDLKFSEIIADTETTKPLQRCAARLDRPAEVPPVVHEALRSPGQPLDFETQAFMETRFGHDFNRVRVHTAAPAEESARLMGARSYTVGPDIVFANGSYGPTTTEGRKLLAHELAHVVQQRGQDGAGVQGELEVSQPTDAAETEADQVAERVMQGLTQNAIVMQRAALQLQRMPDVGFTVNNMNLAKGLLDDPTDNGMGVVTWPLSFAVTSPLEAAPEVEITGSAGDPCTSHSVGFLQTVHIQWIHIHYQGRSTGDGSTVLSYTVPLPIRDGDPGDMWYTTDGVDTPTGCNVTIHPHMDDYPTLWDIAKVRTNSLTGQANYLTYITRGIHFVTTLADSGPAGVKPLRFFYWNYLMDIEFTPNYASPNAVWPFKWKKNTATIGKVHTGGDSSVPMFTSATTPYNQSLTLNTVESK